MSYLFTDCFKFIDANNKPYNWLTEINSPVPHSNAVVKDGAFTVLLSGNKHFAHTPPLKNFELQLGLHMRLAPRTENAGFEIFFRYDRFLRTGYFLRCSFNAKSVSVETGIIRNLAVEIFAGQERHAPICNSNCSVLLSVKDNNFKLQLNDELFEFNDAAGLIDHHGHIGMDKTHFSGELSIHDLKLSSNDRLEKRTVLEPLAFALPCVSGMSVPYKYSFKVDKYSNGPYALELELGGGIRGRPERKRQGGWCFEIDTLTNPYMRIESPVGELKNIILHNGPMILFDKEEHRPFPIVHAPVEWPLKRTVYFENLPDPSLLYFAIGYEDFVNDPIRYAGGPFEVILDSKGRPRYQGESVRKGKVAISVESPKDKLLCALIPKDMPDYEKAIAHAAGNHYFLEEERICFDTRIYYRAADFCEKAFGLKVQPQTVFGEPLKENIKISSPAAEAPGDAPFAHALGIRSLRFHAAIAERLPAGVYHLAISLSHSDKTLRAETVAFEVISQAPDALPPPIASGLPWLYSAPNEVANLETDAFDPLSARAGKNNAEHYFSINCFFPQHGRTTEIWKLLSVYRRKWFLWMTGRTCGLESRKIEDNKDIIAHCDFLNAPYFSTATEDLGRFDLWHRSYYKHLYLELLAAFLKERPGKFAGAQVLGSKFIEKLMEDQASLPEDAYFELFEKYGEEWIGYINRRLPAIWKKDRMAIRRISENVRRSDYGPIPVYYCHHKTAYFMKCTGLGNRSAVDQNYDGFFQFEDYPYECGYPISQAIFAMMTIKLYHPNLKIFPEIYDTAIEGCNDGALVLAHPPYGAPVLPPYFTAKRIFEFCFGAIWFKDNRFHFWNDNGFHFRNPTRESVRELISAWGRTRKLRPLKPIKTTCFLFDLDLIGSQADCFERNEPGRWIEFYNTAEEDLSYAYKFSRENGLPAGFVTSCADLRLLSAEDIDLLVIPPLNTGLPEDILQTIRDLHRQGVNLLGFENVSGLEDIFGVKAARKSMPIRKIGVSPEFAECFANGSTELVRPHKLCATQYENCGAHPVLLGTEDVAGVPRVPVLSIHQTPSGETAFFNIPPTVVNREPRKKEIYGCECMSPVIADAFAYVLKRLSRPLIMAENGNLIALHDIAGEKIVVILEENSVRPDDGRPSDVILKIGRSHVKAGDVSSDQEYFVAAEAPDKLILRFVLEKHDSAIVYISGPSGFSV